MLLLAALSAAAAPPLAASPEVRWYTDHAVSRQIEEERAAATGLLSCCSGFVVFENSSFVCGPADPQSKDSWNRSTTPYLDTGLTVDHVISVPSVAKEDGVMRHGTMVQNWTRARPGIPAVARCADAGDITGFLIDWEPHSNVEHWPLAEQLAAAREYAEYANELANELHKSGRRLGLALDGCANSPIDRFSVFAAAAPNVDYFTLMCTYHWRANGTRAPTEGIVSNALAQGIPPAKLCASP